jgi:hypothetical protein
VVAQIEGRSPGPVLLDVRAYIYLDGGPRGKPLIIGAGPHNAWLLELDALTH